MAASLSNEAISLNHLTRRFVKAERFEVVASQLTKGLGEEERVMFSTLFYVAAVILDIFAISDVMNSSRDIATKVVLIALILLIPFVGAGLYLFAFRDKGYS
jgi:hypothetical protein